MATRPSKRLAPMFHVKHSGLSICLPVGADPGEPLQGDAWLVLPAMFHVKQWVNSKACVPRETVVREEI